MEERNEEEIGEGTEEQKRKIDQKRMKNGLEQKMEEYSIRYK